MKLAEFSRTALSSCVAAAMLAGCGGSQPPIGAPGATLQSRAIATQADRARSWMLPEANSDDLLYIADKRANRVRVYSSMRADASPASAKKRYAIWNVSSLDW